MINSSLEHILLTSLYVVYSAQIIASCTERAKVPIRIYTRVHQTIGEVRMIVFNHHYLAT